MRGNVITFKFSATTNEMNEIKKKLNSRCITVMCNGLVSHSAACKSRYFCKVLALLNEHNINVFDVKMYNY